jgi:hypothetical protein
MHLQLVILTRRTPHKMEVSCGRDHLKLLRHNVTMVLLRYDTRAVRITLIVGCR